MKLQSLILSVFVIALLFAATNAIDDNEKQRAKESRGRVGEEKLRMQSLKNSSMAERSSDAFNEHAVDDNPEEIASMVDM